MMGPPGAKDTNTEVTAVAVGSIPKSHPRGSLKDRKESAKHPLAPAPKYDLTNYPGTVESI